MGSAAAVYLFCSWRVAAGRLESCEVMSRLRSPHIIFVKFEVRVVFSGQRVRPRNSGGYSAGFVEGGHGRGAELTRHKCFGSGKRWQVPLCTGV